MPLPTEFRQVEDNRDLRLMADFGDALDLGYPGFRVWWHEKAMNRIETGYGIGIIAVHERVAIAAELLYVFPEERRAEVKFFRSAPEYGDEGNGSYTWRAGELKAREELGVSDDQPITLTLDTPEDNHTALTFFRRRGCTETARGALYTPSRRDVLLTKQVQAPRRRAA